jgi:hypothetical protein
MSLEVQNVKTERTAPEIVEKESTKHENGCSTSGLAKTSMRAQKIKNYAQRSQCHQK